MGKKEKRISINALEKIATEQFTACITEQWHDIEVTIKPSLTLVEMIGFVKDIADMCFTEDGTYMPEVMDFSIKSGILTRYANFTMPDNIEKQYWLICNTDASDMVCQHINMKQLSEIVSSAKKKIKQLCNTDIVATRAKLNELHDAFSKLGEEFSDTFSGIAQSDIQNAMDVFSKSELTEDKIVSAYMKHMKQNEEESLHD